MADPQQHYDWGSRTGAFRKHFFGDATMAEVVRCFASESVKYATPTLMLQKRLGFRQPCTHVAYWWAHTCG